MKKILICGVGGIGSFIVRELNRLVLNGQIDIDDFNVTITDMDSVELKNIKYQLFDKTDIFKNKAEVLGDRFCFHYKKDKIKTADQFKDYDLIVSAVDNSATRKLIYDYCFSTDKYFIDLRSEGRSFAFFTKEMPQAELQKFLKGEMTEEGASCQLKHELDQGIIQNGNVIIAAIGSQLILNWTRGIQNPMSLVIRI